MTSLRTLAISGLGAAAGMVALPVACAALRSVGPAARVLYYEYLPLDLVVLLPVALFGAALGADAGRRFRPPASPGALRHWPRVRSAILLVIAAWVAWPQLRAFPASAGLVEREAWARERLPAYAALTRVIAALPEVQRDLGRIVAIAPTSSDSHSAARTMNGDDMSFTLEVAGEKGTGTFRVDCTLDDDAVYDWRSGVWSFGGREVRVSTVERSVPPVR